MPWNFLRDRKSSLKISEVTTEEGVLKRVTNSRLPYWRQNIDTPAIGGARQHSYFWNQDSLHKIRQVMNTDSTEGFSESELRAWNEFIEFQDTSTHSAIDTQIGCTIVDAKNYSYPLLEDGTIDYTDMCTKPTRVHTDPIVVKSLDNILCDMVYKNDQIKTAVETPAPPILCPSIPLLVYDETTSVPHTIIENKKYVAPTVVTGELNNLTYMSIVNSYILDTVECPSALRLAFAPCDDRASIPRFNVFSAVDELAVDAIDSFDTDPLTFWTTNALKPEIDITITDRKLFQYYTVQAPLDPSQMTKNWILAGWNEDFQTWEKIDRRFDEADWTANESRNYVIQFADYYDKIRYRVMDNIIIPKSDIISMVPILESNTSINGIVSGSSIYDSSFDFFKAFDKNTTTQWANASGNTGEIQYTNENSLMNIKSYTIQARESYVNQAPKDWTLEGSNDGITWIILDTIINESSWTVNEVRTFSVNTNENYNRLKLNITDNDGGGNVSIAELEFIGIVATAETKTIGSIVAFYEDAPLPIPSIDNIGIYNCDIDENLLSPTLQLAEYSENNYILENILNPLSDYTSEEVIVTASGWTNESEAPWKALDFTSTSSWTLPQNVSVGNILLELTTISKADVYMIKARDSYSNMAIKSFELLASNDNITFTSLDIRTNEIGWTVNEERLYEISTALEYKYYKLEIYENNGDQYTAINEFTLLKKKEI